MNMPNPPEHGSLSDVLNGQRRVKLLSGSRIPSSLPNQTFSIIDPLTITRIIRGPGSESQNRWRSGVPPDILTEIDTEFPIRYDNTQMPLDV